VDPRLLFLFELLVAPLAVAILILLLVSTVLALWQRRWRSG
jgi:hypothetical protein